MAAGNVIATLLVKIGVEVKDATKGIKDLEKGLKDTEKGTKSFAKNFRYAAGVLGLGLVAKKIFTETADFQEALSKLGVATKTTGKDLEKLGQEAITLSNKFGVSAEEILHGMETLRNLGLSTADALEVLPAILQTVVGVGADFETTAAVMETVLNDFNKTAKDSTHITDVLIETMRQGNFDMQSWREAMKEAGSAAASANASFEDVATSLSVLGKAGITGGRAGTALRNIFLGINKELAKGAPLFQKYGIEVKNSDGTFKNFSEIISSIQERFKELNPQQKTAFEQALVGKEAYSALDTILQRSPESFSKLTQAMKESAGQTKAAGEAQLNTINGQLSRLKTLTSNWGKQIGDSLGGISVGILKFVNDTIETIQKENEIFFSKASQKWEAFKSWLSGVWDSIVQGAKTAWAKVTQAAEEAGRNVKTKFTNLLNEAKSWGSNLISNFAQGIRDGIDKAISAAKAVATAVANFLRSRSPTKLGPLSDSDKWMPNLMNMFAEGLETGIPKLEMAVGDVAATIATADTMAASSVTNNNTINVSSRQNTLDERGLGRMLERMRILNGGVI
jgi:TP901 family phage tail tape measure protein